MLLSEFDPPLSFRVNVPAHTHSPKCSFFEYSRPIAPHIIIFSLPTPAWRKSLDASAGISFLEAVGHGMPQALPTTIQPRPPPHFNSILSNPLFPLLDVVVATRQGDRLLRFGGKDGSMVFDTSVFAVHHEELRSTQLPGSP